MPEQQDAVDPAAPATPGAGAALRGGGPTRSPAETCREIERALGRDPGERVKCAHLFGDYYRCNWWVRVAGPGKAAGPDWTDFLTETVRKSRFLRATPAAGRLRIEDVAETTGGPARAMTRGPPEGSRIRRR